MIQKIIIGILFCLPLFGQGAGTPNCQFTYELTNRTTEKTDGVTVLATSGGAVRTPAINNRNTLCNSWYMSVAVDGFSAVSLELDDAQNTYTIAGGTPTSWAAFEGAINSGTNPSTAITSSSLNVTGFYPWLSVNLASSTGTGSIYVTLYGWKSPTLLGALPLGNSTALSLVIGGSPATSSGGIYEKGITSGGVALVAADIAGTPITYILPSTNGTVGQALIDSGSITCPTLIAAFPTTCHLLQFSTVAGTVVAKGNAFALTGNLSATTIFTLPGSNGRYQVCLEEGLAQAATVSSSFPTISMSYSSSADGGVRTILLGNQVVQTGNSLGIASGGCAGIDAAIGSVLQYQTNGYISSGATPMQYFITWTVTFISQT